MAKKRQENKFQRFGLKLSIFSSFSDLHTLLKAAVFLVIKLAKSALSVARVFIKKSQF